MIKTYYALAKPGMVYGNAIAAAGGFLLAARGHDNFWAFIAMLFGICFVMGAACVFNNVIDRHIDAKMKRTQKRALVQGEISPRNALIYGTALALVGFGVLLFLVNILAAAIAFVGFVFYVVLYAIGKRRSVHGTLVGSVSGAIPPVVGYVAVAGHLDAGAWILFFIMTAWQMPHFYAIATYRRKDYAAAAIPVMPLVKGITTTKKYMVGYVVAFLVAASALVMFGYQGYTYLAIMLGLSVWWLTLALRGFTAQDDDAWARSMFGRSLIVLVVFCTTISLTPLLP